MEPLFLPRPRDYAVVTSAPFVEMKREIMGHLHDEVQKSANRTTQASACPPHGPL